MTGLALLLGRLNFVHSLLKFLDSGFLGRWLKTGALPVD